MAVPFSRPPAFDVAHPSRSAAPSGGGPGASAGGSHGGGLRSNDARMRADLGFDNDGDSDDAESIGTAYVGGAALGCCCALLPPPPPLPHPNPLTQ